MTGVTIDLKAISDFENFYRVLPEVTSRAASIAINDTMKRFVLPEARKRMYEQINFPAGYLDDDKRLWIDEFSTPTKLQGKVKGRDRATSLVQFAEGADTNVSRGHWKRFTGDVRVQGSRGGAIAFGGKTPAYIVPLLAGPRSEGRFTNVGLAVRLRPGEQLRNVRDLSVRRKLFGDTYLLYGPSVDQVFQGVALQMKDETAEFMREQFYRQYARLTNG